MYRNICDTGSTIGARLLVHVIMRRCMVCACAFGSAPVDLLCVKSTCAHVSCTKVAHVDMYVQCATVYI